MNWKEKLILSEGDDIRFIHKFEAGHLGQKERYTYDIVNSLGEKIGSIKYVEETSIKPPFKEHYSLAQYDINQNEIIFECW